MLFSLAESTLSLMPSFKFDLEVILLYFIFVPANLSTGDGLGWGIIFQLLKYCFSRIDVTLEFSFLKNPL